MIVADMKQEHARDVAILHIQGISTGFISSLGIGFVTALYEAIAENKSNLGFVAEQENRVPGFITFTEQLWWKEALRSVHAGV
jgi:hypothetical protein